MAGGAADDRAQPRQQFLDPERLRQIVVGAGVDSVDALGPACARGQDQHRHVTAIRAPALEHGKPVHPRQPEIENDRAIILGVAAEPCFFAVAHGFDDVASGFERARNIRCDPPVVLDKKYTHHFSLIRSISPLRAST